MALIKAPPLTLEYFVNNEKKIPVTLPQQDDTILYGI